ncbi:MAG: cellulose biosynthesis cyclic di-GMP-binding regulatory protein BcsB [Peptostreptococcaceae bacterium]
MKKYIILLAMIVMVAINTNITFAYDNVEIYKHNQDINMNGVVSKTERFFYIYDNWDAKEAKFNLVFTKSELLNISQSTITVEVNGTNVFSKRLDGKKEYKDEIQVSIPTDLLKSGQNSLVIKAYKTISDKVCQDDSNTANWLVVHKESNINIAYDYKQVENSISKISEIFPQVNQGKVVDTVIVLPDNSTNAEIESAMNLSLYLGKKLKNQDFNLDVKFESELKNKDKNIIYIGSINNASNEIKKLFSQNEIDELGNRSIIKISDSPYTKQYKKVLAIIHNNDKALKTATKLLTGEELTKNINSQSIYVQEDTDADEIYTKKNYSNISFKDMGYGDSLLEGPFTQETTYEIVIPKGKLSSTNTVLNLDFRYSKNLDFERSLVTVYLNDAPIGSKKLSKENADNDSLSINVPKDQLNKSYYQVKVKFNLKIKDMECVTRDVDSPWAYVLNTSEFNFKYKDKISTDLKLYPYPFVNEELLNNVDLVIGNNITSDRLTNIANIVGYIGRDVKYNNNQINVISEEEFKNRKEDKNTIIVGTPSDNSVVREINDELFIKYDDSFKEFVSNDKVKLFEDGYSDNLSTVQLIPTKNNTNYLVVSAVNEAELNVAIRHLTDSLDMSKLEMDSSLISGSKIENFRFKETKNDLDSNVKEDEKSYNFTNETITFMIIAVVLIFMLGITVFLLIKKHKNNK